MNRMPFGKFKGRSFREIPDYYLKWGMKNFTDAQLLDACRDELAEREKEGKIEETAEEFLRRHGVNPKKFR